MYRVSIKKIIPLCISFSSLLFFLGHPQHLASYNIKYYNNKFYYLKKNRTSHN